MPFLSPILSPLSPNASIRIIGGVEANFASDQSARNHRYVYNEAFLANRIYRTEAKGGFRAQIFDDTFGLTCTPDLRLIGAYNPVPAIVGAYQNVFRGTFGNEIKVDDEVDGKPVNPRLVDGSDSPVARIWRWSDLDTEKHLLQEWAANLGTVGLRPVAENADDPDDRRVYIQLYHPGAISDFDLDARGNVTAVLLEYELWGGPIGKRQKVKVKELLDKTSIMREVDGKVKEKPNDLGVCPFVILRHRDDGGDFGKWAYSGAEDTIHWINWMIVNQGTSIMEHAWPQWFAAAGGPSPTEATINGRKLAYVKMDPDTPPPIFQPLVAPLDHAGALAFLQEQVAWLQERQPELAIVAMKVLSGQSGETIAKLQVQAEAAIKRARAQYEHATIRAVQIGLSEGVRMGLWDLGTGTGSAEAADKAYQDGLEDFAFTERAALPPTPFDQITQAQANTAEQKAKFELASAGEKAGVDDMTQLQLAGYTEEQARKMLAKKAREDIIPDEATGQDFRKVNGNGRAAARA